MKDTKKYTIQEFDVVGGWGRKKTVTEEVFNEYMLNKGYCPKCKASITCVSEEGRTLLSCKKCGNTWTN